MSVFVIVLVLAFDLVFLRGENPMYANAITDVYGSG